MKIIEKNNLSNAFVRYVMLCGITVRNKSIEVEYEKRNLYK